MLPLTIPSASPFFSDILTASRYYYISILTASRYYYISILTAFRYYYISILTASRYYISTTPTHSTALPSAGSNSAVSTSGDLNSSPSDLPLHLSGQSLLPTPPQSPPCVPFNSSCKKHPHLNANCPSQPLPSLRNSLTHLGPQLPSNNEPASDHSGHHHHHSGLHDPHLLSNNEPAPDPLWHHRHSGFHDPFFGSSQLNQPWGPAGLINMDLIYAVQQDLNVREQSTHTHTYRHRVCRTHKQTHTQTQTYTHMHKRTHRVD